MSFGPTSTPARKVPSASASVMELGWLVFVELPLAEADTAIP